MQKCFRPGTPKGAVSVDLLAGRSGGFVGRVTTCDPLLFVAEWQVDQTARLLKKCPTPGVFTVPEVGDVASVVGSC